MGKDYKECCSRWDENLKKVLLLDKMLKEGILNDYTFNYINEVFEEGFEMFETEQIEIFSEEKIRELVRTRELSAKLSGEKDHTESEKNRNKLYPNTDALYKRLPGSYGTKR